MNEHSLHVKVVTPNGVVFDYETATLVVLSTTGGEVGVMANHAPIIAALKVSEVKIVDDVNGVEERLAVSGGFAEFSSNELTVVAAERAADIDITRAESAKERAERRLADDNSTRDVERAQVALLRAVNRIHVASGKK